MLGWSGALNNGHKYSHPWKRISLMENQQPGIWCYKSVSCGFDWHELGPRTCPTFRKLFQNYKSEDQLFRE